MLYREPLPLGKALGGIDAEDVHARRYKCRHAFGIIACIDARTDNIALVVVRQLEIVFLIIRIVFAEHHIAKTLIFIYEREHIELMIPNEIVRMCQRRGICIRPNEFFERRHKCSDFRIERHARYAIIAARHNSDKFPVGRTVLGYCHRRMPCLCEQIEHAAERRLRTDIRITADKPGFIIFYTGNHRRFLCDTLRSINE